MKINAIQHINQSIVDLLGLDQTDLFDLQVDYGMRYLDRICHGDHERYEALRDCPEFWDWWRTIWSNRDRVLLNKCERAGWGIWYTYFQKLKPGVEEYAVRVCFLQPQVWDFYKSVHNWRNLDFYPNTIIVQRSIQRKNMTKNTHKSIFKTSKQQKYEYRHGDKNAKTSN